MISYVLPSLLLTKETKYIILFILFCFLRGRIKGEVKLRSAEIFGGCKIIGREQ